MLACFCEEPMIMDNEVLNIFATRCGHIFHKSCLVQWLEQSQTCPQCRGEVNESEIFRLYPALSDDGPHEDINNVLQSCLESLEDTKLQLEHMTAVCKEKDDLITNLKADAEKIKKFGQENEALKSLLQMLDGLKDMATIICKTVDNSVQRDTVPELTEETSNVDVPVTQPTTEPSGADAAASQARIESPDSDYVVIEPRIEAGNADVTVNEPNTESGDTNSAANEPNTESVYVVATVDEPRTEHLNDDAATSELRMELSDDATITQTSTAVPPDNNDVNDELSNESVHLVTGIIQSETQSAVSRGPGVSQPRTDSSADAAVSQHGTNLHDVVETVETHSDASLSGIVTAETAAIKSSLDTLGHMLIRISEDH